MSAKLVSLMDFVPAATLRFKRPLHLAPVVEMLERTEREAVRCVVSIAPRHRKTELVKHAIVRRLRMNPATRVIYSTYGQRFSEKRSREMRSIYKRVGGELDDDARARADWRTGVEDGGVWATSVGGSVTGEGGDLIIIDDPHRGRADAESQLERDKTYEWFRDDLSTRAEPGASIVVVQTRWHPDDLAGHLIGEGWEYISLPAIDHLGRALLPESYSVEALEKIRESVGEYTWWSLYMQQPRPRGGAVFQGVRFYDSLPTTAYKIGKGADFAYSAKTRADRSAGVTMLAVEDLFYIVDVRTARCQVPDFVSVLSNVDQKYPGPWHWFASTTEMGLAQLANSVAGVRIKAERAAQDKFMRAQPLAAAWNAGKVLLPRQAPWLDDFVTELCGFTGVGDRRDDVVDAAASAFVSIAPGIAKPPSLDDFNAFRKVAPRANDWGVRSGSSAVANPFGGVTQNFGTHTFTDLSPRPNRNGRGGW